MRGKGFEKRVAPSTAPHPDFQTSKFNGAIKPQISAPSPARTTESGWVGIPRGPEWRRYVQATTEFYSVTSTGKDAIQ